MDRNTGKWPYLRHLILDNDNKSVLPTETQDSQHNVKTPVWSRDHPSSVESVPFREDLPRDLQDQLDLMSMYYWEECRALICTACKPDDMTYTRSMLHRHAVLEHLLSFHNFNSDTQLNALERCLEKLPSLAQSPSQLGEPIPNLPPRPFLPPPRRGWSCSKCSFCTDDFRENKWHFENRHFSTLKWNEFPMEQIDVQRVDGTYFPVLIEDSSIPKRKEASSLDTGLPSFLRYWVECKAIVCVECEDDPMLSRKDVIPHLRDHHGGDQLERMEKSLADIDYLSGLAEKTDDIRLPLPNSGEIPFISAPMKGWQCSSTSCGYASESLDSVLQHESEDHPEQVSSPEKRNQVLVQYVTLSTKPICFPVARIDTPVSGSNGSHDTVDEPTDFVFSEEINQKANEFSFGNEDAVKSGEPFRDTHTDEDRRQILADLWDNPTSSDLKPLNRKQTQQKLRELSMQDRSDGAKEVRRFPNIYLQAILQTQHKIIQFEERMSRGEFIGIEKLNSMLIEYASLIKSYKELYVLKQVHKDGKSFAKFFATELHEPRYWYSPDAIERIDLVEDLPRASHDIIRKFLQQKMPVMFLDSVGKRMRELDRIEDSLGKSTGGKVTRISERYRRHGRYISSSVDNFARVLFALFGGLFLLAPMVALAYITSTKWLVISTVLFVFVFAILLGLFSKRSNHELIAATAAYAAVLVVFVGNTIGPGPTIQPLEL